MFKNNLASFDIDGALETPQCSQQSSQESDNSELFLLEVSKEEVIDDLCDHEPDEILDGIEAVNSIVQENKGFEYHPNHFIHGKLCQKTFAELEEKSMLADQHLEGWQPFEVYDDAKSGYYGVLFINFSKKHAVLAHRGVVPKWIDVLNKDSGLRNGTEILMGEALVEQQAQAYIATKKAVEFCQQHCFYLSATGYGLGAVLAEMSVYHCHWQLNYKLIKAITFESYGSANIMERLKSNIKNKESQINLAKLNIITYLSVPNILNCHAHLGKVYQLKAKIEESNWLVNCIAKQFNASYLGLIYNAFKGEDLLSAMLECFDHQTGMPIDCDEMEDWPCVSISNHSVFFNVRCDVVDVLGKTVLPNFIKKSTSELADKYLCHYTSYSIIKLCLNFLAGNINLGQFHYVRENLLIKDALSEQKEFELIYKGHYKKAKKAELNKKILNENDVIEDFYLYRLYKYQKDILTSSMLDNIIEIQLKALLEEYNIELKNGKNVLISKEMPVHKLENWLRRLIEIYGQDIDNAIAYAKKPDKFNGQKIAADLPSKQIDFIGRKALLKEIHNHFKSEKFVILQGFAGVGKSALALTYAQQRMEEMVNVRWFDGQTKQKIDNKFRQLAIEMQISIINKPVNIIRNEIYAKLATMQDVLFIFDNVVNFNEIKDYLQLPRNVKILFTTCNEKPPFITSYKCIKIPLFTLEESKKLLKSCLGDGLNDSKVSELANLLGCFPFALNKAASFLMQNQLIQIDNYIKKYTIAKAKYSPAIMPYFTISVEKLYNKEGERKSWEFAQYLAWLDGSFIPINILYKLGFSRKEIQVHEKELSSLSIASFVFKNGEVTGLQMPGLLQEAIKLYIFANPEHCLDYQKVLIELGRVLCEVFPVLSDIPDRKWSYSMMYTNGALELLSALEKYNLCLIIRAKLYSKLGDYSDKIEINYSQSLEYYQKALSLWRIIDLPMERINLANLLSRMGKLSHKICDFKNALIFKEEALELYLKIYPESHSIIAKEYGELSWIQQKIGDREQSLICSKKSSEICEELYPEDHYHKARALYWLSAALRKSGRISESLICAKKAQEMCEKLMDDQHPLVANQLINFAASYYCNKDFINSMKCLDKSLLIYKAYYSEKHPNYAIILQNIGICLVEMGENGRAKEYLTNALKVYEDLYPQGNDKITKVNMVIARIEGVGGCKKRPCEENEAREAPHKRRRLNTHVNSSELRQQSML